MNIGFFKCTLCNVTSTQEFQSQKNGVSKKVRARAFVCVCVSGGGISRKNSKPFLWWKVSRKRKSIEKEVSKNRRRTKRWNCKLEPLSRTCGLIGNVTWLTRDQKSYGATKKSKITVSKRSTTSLPG